MKATPWKLPATILTFLLVMTLPAACGGGGGGTGPGGTGYGAGGGGGGSSGGSTPDITMGNYYFSPAVDTVAAGTTVKWTNSTTGTTHTSTSDNGVWDSGDIAPGKTYSYTFSTAGSYPYHCKYHVSVGMKGTIVVK